MYLGPRAVPAEINYRICGRFGETPLQPAYWAEYAIIDDSPRPLCFLVSSVVNNRPFDAPGP